MYTVDIQIRLKKGVADPEGKNTRKALALLGFSVGDVHTSKIFTITFDAQSPEEAEAVVDDMCRKLLANPVIHNYDITFR